MKSHLPFSRWRVVPPVLIATLLICSQNPSSAQEAVATFKDGIGTSKADQFPGVSGDGWTAGWKTYKSGSLQIQADIPDASLAARLAIQMTTLENPEELNNGSVVRLYDTASLPHLIRFRIRLDRIDGSNSSGNFIGAFGGRNPHQNTKGDSTWVIRSLGKNPGEWKWAAYHGTADGEPFLPRQMMEIGGRGKGMPVEIGKTYEIIIASHTDKGAYDVTISNGSQSVHEEGLLYRAAAKDWAPGQAGIAFHSQLKESGDTITFSISDVQISPLR